MSSNDSPSKSNPADVAYLSEHSIPQLMNELTKELFQDKPDDVVGYLIESLKRKRARRDAAELDADIAASASATKF